LQLPVKVGSETGLTAIKIETFLFQVEEGAVINDFIVLRSGNSHNNQQTLFPEIGKIQNISS